MTVVFKLGTDENDSDTYVIAGNPIVSIHLLAVDTFFTLLRVYCNYNHY